MYTVGGNTDTLKAFLAALGSSHGYDGRVEAWYAGELIAQVQYESGSVKVSARSRERRSLTLTVSERLWPKLPKDPASPFGVWLRAYATVTASATVFPEVPVFAGPVIKPERVRWSGKVTVSCKDPFRQINREAFEGLRRAPEGVSIVDVIRILVVEVFPAATVIDLTGSLAVVPAGTAWDAGNGSRGNAIDGLAASIGAEVIALPVAVSPGGVFLIRPVPSLNDPVVWTLPDGLASIVAADEQSKSGDEVKNRWIVTSEGSTSNPIRQVVTDDNPVSATRYGGPMGKIPGFYSSPMITSGEQAIAAGAAKLSRSIGLARTRSVTVPANPALEGGDVLAIGVDGEPVETHIADEFTVPLQHIPAEMKIDTRSTGADDVTA